eukprot:7687534-Ditylum_brightwellii.AAC.1
MAGCNCNIDHFDANTVDVITLGEQNVVCRYCGALGFSSENRGTEEQPHFGVQCCNKGKVQLNPFPNLPNGLYSFLTGNDSISKYFQKNIRMLNSGMAMTSFQIDDKTIHHGPPGAYKIQGQVY